MRVKNRKLKADIVSVCGKEGAKQVLLAVKKKMPIMIYDRHFSGSDPILYRALKGLGAPIVRNYDMLLERDGEASGVYCTVFVDHQSKTVSSFANAGESSEMLKQ